MTNRVIFVTRSQFRAKTNPKQTIIQLGFIACMIIIGTLSFIPEFRESYGTSFLFVVVPVLIGVLVNDMMN